jgi:hypothetical protein
VLFTTAVLTASAGAAVILNLVISPATTAGGGATSTRSGANAFQIYAIDTAGFGISGYNLTMGPVVTASNNRTPLAFIQDADLNIVSAGFDTSRSASNAPQMHGLQNFPGSTPYLIQGMGQTLGSFTDVAAAGPNQPASVVGLPTSGTWGGPYNNGVTSGTKKWLFIGEGLWDTSVPITSPTQFVSAATFTVYSDQDFHSVAAETIFPCLLNCRPPTVVDAEFYNVEADDPGMMTHLFTTSGSSPIIWDNFMFDSYSPLPGGSGAGPANPAAFDTSVAKFSWNTSGSPAGTYTWHFTASNPFGVDQGSITIHIAAVPEPTTLTLVSLALLGLPFGIRCRPLSRREGNRAAAVSQSVPDKSVSSHRLCHATA